MKLRAYEVGYNWVDDKRETVRFVTVVAVSKIDAEQHVIESETHELVMFSVETVCDGIDRISESALKIFKNRGCSLNKYS